MEAAGVSLTSFGIGDGLTSSREASVNTYT